MNETRQKLLSAALLRLLRPLARLLMRHGMSYGSFAELARKAYVDEGFLECSRNGGRASISSVSALTGLTRKETKRLRELDILDDSDSAQRYNRAIRVISGWTSDKRYLTGAGAPAVLPLEGESRSFAALVRDFSGDIPPAAMLSVLEASNTVSVADKCVTLEARAYMPGTTPDEKITILGNDVAELIDTIGHNFEATPAQRRFQRKVSNVSVHPDTVPAFKQFSDRKSQQLLEEYHEWLSTHQVSDDDHGKLEPAYIAVGIYYTDQPPSVEEDS